MMPIKLSESVIDEIMHKSFPVNEKLLYCYIMEDKRKIYLSYEQKNNIIKGYLFLLSSDERRALYFDSININYDYDLGYYDDNEFGDSSSKINDLFGNDIVLNLEEIEIPEKKKLRQALYLFSF